MRLQPTTELESTLAAFATLAANAGGNPADAELQQKHSGTKYEIELAVRMQKSLSGLFCYHNFKGRYRDSCFEIDFMLLTSAGKALLIEVKGYSGFYDLCPTDSYLLDKIDRGAQVHQVKNPLPQLARAKKFLTRIIDAVGIPITFESIVVFADDKFWPSKPLLNSFYGQKEAMVTTRNGFLEYVETLTVSPFFSDNPLSPLVDFLFYQQKKSPIFFDPFFFRQ